jgi:CheY-like chemotaxis protein
MGNPLEPPVPPPTVLVCNTEPVLRMLVQATLELAGYSVIGASSGAEALACMRDDHPDLIVLGTMPRVSGSEVLDTMQGDPATAATPVIMLPTLAHASPTSERAGAPQRLMQLCPRDLATLAGALLSNDDGELQELHDLARAC